MSWTGEKQRLVEIVAGCNSTDTQIGLIKGVLNRIKSAAATNQEISMDDIAEIQEHIRKLPGVFERFVERKLG